ncbi:hypothetical protein V5P93_004915 [Actinokineospora auranticolor]|uniref:ABC-type branched-subunit amino acid transport system substrate-binding protein n=1 Tax=Actinokineospora auranticolor TaxID=155976 RepID=A0A2S6GNU0_9PSEU|nr:hypothetical protein [Actinokineospora auranticolor]PPK66877.1 hypothetical protein CLV40_109262 [Actinokineospora auranticolor]
MWSRTWLLTLVPAVFVGAVGFVGYTYFDNVRTQTAQDGYAHCGKDPESAGARHLVRVGNDCVGVTEGDVPFLANAGPLRSQKIDRFHTVQGVVRNQNAEVAAAESRPVATIVFVTALSARDDSLTANTYRLMGVAAQQRALLRRSNRSDPLLRILVANAGDEMKHGGLMVDKIKELVAEDPTVIGVVGLAQSRQPTLDTVRALGNLGLPSIAVTLPADTLVDQSRTYYQVSPTNQRQADVVGYIHDQLATTSIIVYRSDDKADIYSANLAEDVFERGTGLGMRVDIVGYQPEGAPADKTSAREVSDKACERPDRPAVFFAGRPADFQRFLDGYSSRPCANPPRRIVAGDDISRYVASIGSRSDVPFDYVSFGPTTPRCDGIGDLQAGARDLFDDCADGNHFTQDGQAALTFDATAVFATAVGRLGNVPISPGAVWREIDQINGAAALNGQSGLIDHAGSRVPIRKFITILAVSVNPLEPVASCGKGPATPDSPPQAAWCP